MCALRFPLSGLHLLPQVTPLLGRFTVWVRGLAVAIFPRSAASEVATLLAVAVPVQPRMFEAGEVVALNRQATFFRAKIGNALQVYGLWGWGSITGHHFY